jgi:hypothetical protein
VADDMSDEGFVFTDPVELVRCTRCSTIVDKKDAKCPTCGPLKIRESDVAKKRSLLRGDPVRPPPQNTK